MKFILIMQCSIFESICSRSNDLSLICDRRVEQSLTVKNALHLPDDSFKQCDGSGALITYIYFWDEFEMHAHLK